MCKKYDGERADALLFLFEKDKTLQQIARYRYVDGLTIPETAILVGYCERQVQRHCKKIEERMAASCIDCIHYEVCIEWQDIEDKARKQSHTTEEDFLLCEHHKDCRHFERRA